MTLTIVNWWYQAGLDTYFFASYEEAIIHMRINHPAIFCTCPNPTLFIKKWVKDFHC